MEQIRLENEQIEVTVNIHGAELRSLKSKADGQEYLWNADAKYWGRTSPVLFPFVGGVKNKVYRHEGKEYPMNQMRHGWRWRIPMKPVKSIRFISIWRLDTDWKEQLSG